MGGFRPGSFAATLSAADLAALHAGGRVRRFPSGRVLFHEGDQPGDVVVVLDGTVKLSKVSLGGREAVLELRGPGDVLGELGAVDGRPRAATALALGPVEVLTVPTSDFRDLLLARGSLAMAVLAAVTARLREATERQLELGTSEALPRLCRRLVELARTHGEPVDGGILLRGPLSQQELAEWAGVSRDGVVRALQALRAAGVVETGRQRILIRDLAALEFGSNA